MLKYTKSTEFVSVFAGRVFAILPLSPNQWTGLSVLAAIVAAYFAYLGSVVYFGVLIAVSFLCDYVDGSVARQRKIVSKKGAFFDGVADRLVESCYIAGLYLLGMPNFIVSAIFWLFGTLVFGTFLTSFVKAYAQHTGVLDYKSAHGMRGILERGERVILLLLALISLVVYPQASTPIIALACVLSVATFIQRFLIVMKS